MAFRCRSGKSLDASGGGDVEVDETYFARDRRFSHRGGKSMKGVVTLVDRSTGRAKSIVIDNVTSRTVGKIVAENMATEARADHRRVQRLSHGFNELVEYSA